MFETAINNGIDFQQYLRLLKDLTAKNKTTGDLQSKEMVDFTTLNISRMSRIYKKTSVQEDLLEEVRSIGRKQYWIVLTEGWCGDAAQSVPVISKIAEKSSDIALKIISRDDHPEIMNAFLTNGSKSIPKLIILGPNLEVLADWGPRPKEAQQMMLDFKKDGSEPYESFQKRLQMWYNNDETKSIQTEITLILKKLRIQ